MTDAELLEYLGLPDGPDEQAFIANLAPARRATYERMHEVEIDLKLWAEGVAPKPTGVIVCREHGKKKALGVVP